MILILLCPLLYETLHIPFPFRFRQQNTADDLAPAIRELSLISLSKGNARPVLLVSSVYCRLILMLQLAMLKVKAILLNIISVSCLSLYFFPHLETHGAEDSSLFLVAIADHKVSSTMNRKRCIVGGNRMPDSLYS